MSAARAPRRRPQPTWAIHSAAGVRVVGGTAPDWWETFRPVDPEPAPARTEPVAIACADCRATQEPTR